MMPGSALASPLDSSFWIAFASMPAGAQYTFAIMLGLVIGSFLNVVAHRLPIMMERAWDAEMAASRGEPEAELPRYNLWVPRSACPHCGHVLRTWDNLPVFSYLLLRGRCRDCHAPIGWQYPVLEIASALLAAAALAHFGPHMQALLAFALSATLLALSAIDMRTGLLPDAITLPLLWAALLANVLGIAWISLSDAVVGAILGYLFLWSVYWLFRLVRGIEGIGHGDLKLLAALGAWLGWQALPQIILIAAVTGAMLGLYAVLRGRMRFEEALPFGPFLAAGGLLTLLCGNFLYAI
jgi:leader peptidase (prepilin peptidase) / N-methyltransferase